MPDALTVVQPGLLSLIEDLGRPGFGAVGVPNGGAADRTSLRLANRLVGNPEDTAAIEVLLGNASFRAGGDLIVAVTGAPVPLTVDGRPVSTDRALSLPDGAELRLGVAEAGARSYVAVRGGLDVERALGSAAADPTTGLGPRKLTAGDVLALGDGDNAAPPSADLAASHVPFGEVTLRVVLGPRDDWFDARSIMTFLTRPYQVSGSADRVGVRLVGPELERSRRGELPSEGTVRGAVQVPPNGQPVIFGPDHPITGGYPVIAVVVAADADLIGQLRPGDAVRFVVA